MLFRVLACNWVALFCIAGGIEPQAKSEAQKQDESRIQQLLPGAKDIEAIEKELNASELAQIEKSVGEKLGDLPKKIKLYKATAKLPDEKDEQTFHVIVLPVEKIKNATLVLAADEKGEVARVQIVQGRTVDLYWKLFLDQFCGEKGTHLEANSMNSPALLADLQKKASSGVTEESKKLNALLQHHRLMWANSDLSDRLYELTHAHGEKSIDVAKEYSKVLGEIDSLSARLNAILDPADLQVYQQKMKELRKVADSIATQVSKKDWDKAFQLTRQSQSLCGKCHNWDGNHWQVPLIRAFEHLREEVGVGKGYFIIGHDLYLPEAVKKEDAQVVATAVKTGLWFLKFSF